MEANINSNIKFEVEVNGGPSGACFCSASKVFATNTLTVEKEGFYTSFKLLDAKKNLQFQCNLIGQNYLK